MLVSGSAVALLAASVLNQLYFKKITSVMPNYSLFLNLLTSSVYVPFFGLIVAYNWGGYPAALRRFPQRKFVVMALIDALSSALMLIGGTYTPGSTQVILGQTSVPISMLLTFICLRVRYSSNQIAGAVIVLLGVSISKISLQPSETSGHVIFIVVFLLSVVPATFSNLYKVCIITSHFIIMVSFKTLIPGNRVHSLPHGCLLRVLLRGPVPNPNCTLPSAAPVAPHTGGTSDRCSRHSYVAELGTTVLPVRNQQYRQKCKAMILLESDR